MKKLLTIIALAGVATLTHAQGIINWQNSTATLISAGGSSTPNVAGQFIYAVFIAPSSTVTTSNQPSAILDSAFQSAVAYNTNAAAAGRLNTRNGLDVGFAPGTTVDVIIRGWSVNAGRTWAEALAYWNNGAPATDMYIGGSLIANDFVLGGGAIPVNNVMGVTPNVVGGFNMGLVPGVIVPEPSSMALAGIGAAALLLFRRRK
jgi:hypothetical protein